MRDTVVEPLLPNSFGSQPHLAEVEVLESQGIDFQPPHLPPVYQRIPDQRQRRNHVVTQDLLFDLTVESGRRVSSSVPLARRSNRSTSGLAYPKGFPLLRE